MHIALSYSKRPPGAINNFFWMCDGQLLMERSTSNSTLESINALTGVSDFYLVLLSDLSFCSFHDGSTLIPGVVGQVVKCQLAYARPLLSGEPMSRPDSVTAATFEKFQRWRAASDEPSYAVVLGGADRFARTQENE